MYSFSIVVIENLYIQTSLMVALSLFRVKEGGGPIYKSEVDIIYTNTNNDNICIHIFIYTHIVLQYTITYHLYQRIYIYIITTSLRLHYDDGKGNIPKIAATFQVSELF